MPTPAAACALPSRLFFVRLTRLCAPGAAVDSWEGATEEQERDLYKATFRLFQKGLGEALCSVLREKSHPHLLRQQSGRAQRSRSPDKQYFRDQSKLDFWQNALHNEYTFW